MVGRKVQKITPPKTGQTKLSLNVHPFPHRTYVHKQINYERASSISTVKEETFHFDNQYYMLCWNGCGLRFLVGMSLHNTLLSHWLRDQGFNWAADIQESINLYCSEKYVIHILEKGAELCGILVILNVMVGSIASFRSDTYFCMREKNNVNSIHYHQNISLCGIVHRSSISSVICWKKIHGHLYPLPSFICVHKYLCF